jgi:hypothetical protein
MTTFGTSHFVSRRAAIAYYRSQGYCDAAAAVDDNIKTGAITIGPPTAKADERVWVNHEEGRYMKSVPDTSE